MQSVAFIQKYITLALIVRLTIKSYPEKIYQKWI